jgi:hypothetical protein
VAILLKGLPEERGRPYEAQQRFICKVEVVTQMLKKGPASGRASKVVLELGEVDIRLLT